MLRYITSLVLAAGLSAGVATSSRPAVLDSIMPLSWSEADFFAETDVPMMGNHCTIWSLNEQKGYWATAAHCVLDEDGVGVEDRDYHIGQAVAVPVAVDFSNDMAVLVSSAIAPALPLGDVAPDWDAAVTSAGHPLGFVDPLITSGRFVGTERFEDFFPGRVFLIFSLVGGPGNSGSPILNSRGQVISVWQIGFTVFGAFAGGVETQKMYEFLAPYASAL